MKAHDEEKKKLIEQGREEGFHLAFDAIIHLLQGNSPPITHRANDKFQQIKKLIEEIRK